MTFALTCSLWLRNNCNHCCSSWTLQQDRRCFVLFSSSLAEAVSSGLQLAEEGLNASVSVGVAWHHQYLTKPLLWSSCSASTVSWCELWQLTWQTLARGNLGLWHWLCSKFRLCVLGGGERRVWDSPEDLATLQLHLRSHCKCLTPLSHT